MEFGWKYFKVYTKCKKCGSEAVVDDSIVYTSLPPKYRYECPNCGHIGYVMGSETETKEISIDEKNI